MNGKYDDYDVGETLAVVSIWTVGVGILVMALFPFALPFLVLALAFGLPLLLLGLPIALLAAVWFGIRGVLRRLGSGREASGPAETARMPNRPAGVTNRPQRST
jgi:hypothetical protein